MVVERGEKDVVVVDAGVAVVKRAVFAVSAGTDCIVADAVVAKMVFGTVVVADIGIAVVVEVVVASAVVVVHISPVRTLAFVFDAGPHELQVVLVSSPAALVFFAVRSSELSLLYSMLLLKCFLLFPSLS